MFGSFFFFFSKQKLQNSVKKPRPLFQRVFKILKEEKVSTKQRKKATKGKTRQNKTKNAHTHTKITYLT